MARVKLCGIYAIEIRRTDKPSVFYIGQTVDLDERVKQHLRAFRRGDHDNVPMQRAFVKYGEAAFSFDLVVPVIRDKEALTRFEQDTLDHFITEYGAPRVKNIMRECVNSHLGVKRRPESIAKLSASLRGQKRTPEQNEANRQRSLGRTHSAETKAKLSEHFKGRPAHPETLRALSENRHSEKRLANLRAAKAKSTYAHSDETKAKIAATLTGRKQSAELVERRVWKLRGRKQSPEAIAKRVASRLANARK